MTLTPRIFGSVLCYFWMFIPSFLVASDFGSVGLIKTPSARMSEDALLGATLSREEIADIYNISFQGTPWLEATFRYSIFNPRNNPRSLDEERDRSY